MMRCRRVTAAQQRGGRRQASGQRTGTRQNQGGQRRQSQQQQRKAQPQQQAAPPKQQAAAPPAETKPITKKQIETIEGAGAAFYGDDLWESKRLELIGKASGEENKTVNIDDLTFDQAEKLADRLDDGLTEFGSYSVFLDAQEAKRQEEEEKGDDALWE